MYARNVAGIVLLNIISIVNIKLTKMEWTNFGEWLTYEIRENCPPVEVEGTHRVNECKEVFVSEEIVLIFDVNALVVSQYYRGTFNYKAGGTPDYIESTIYDPSIDNLEIWFGEEMIEHDMYPKVYAGAEKRIKEQLILI